jgi:hypothetical protein
MMGMRGEVYLAEGGHYSLTIMIVKDNTDMDGTFTARCLDEGDLIRVHGWLFSFELIEAGGDCPLVLEAA